MLQDSSKLMTVTQAAAASSMVDDEVLMQNISSRWQSKPIHDDYALCFVPSEEEAAHSVSDSEKWDLKGVQFRNLSSKLDRKMRAAQAKKARKKKDSFSQPTSRGRSTLLSLRISMINSMFWNVRGVANISTQRWLKKLIRLHSLSFLVLLEPMVVHNKLDDIRLKLGFLCFQEVRSSF